MEALESQEMAGIGTSLSRASSKEVEVMSRYDSPGRTRRRGCLQAAVFLENWAVLEEPVRCPDTDPRSVDIPIAVPVYVRIVDGGEPRRIRVRVPPVE